MPSTHRLLPTFFANPPLHGRVIVALSGGADSVALLCALRQRGDEVVAAAHCNFHLRGTESDRDEAFVKALCRRMDVELRVCHFDTAAVAATTGESIEMAARRLRYEWFDKLRNELAADYVAVAHHQGDNAETLLLNLLRGSGLKGLCGMADEREGIVRPLLQCSRRELTAYLAAKGEAYVTDSTNADTAYRRNYLRHRVLPLLAEANPDIVHTLHATAQRLRSQEAIYRYGLDRLLARHVVKLADRSRFSLEGLAEDPSPQTLLYEFLAPYGFGADVAASLFTDRVGAWYAAKDYLCTRTHSAIEVAPHPPHLASVALPWPQGELSLPDGRSLKCTLLSREQLDAIPRDRYEVALDCAALHGPLVVRSAEASDRFTPFGMKGSKLVSDYLTDRHRSRIDKLKALVVEDRQGIVWLAGETIDERAALTPTTRQVVRLTLTLPSGVADSHPAPSAG